MGAERLHLCGGRSGHGGRVGICELKHQKLPQCRGLLLFKNQHRGSRFGRVYTARPQLDSSGNHLNLNDIFSSVSHYTRFLHITRLFLSINTRYSP